MDTEHRYQCNDCRKLYTANQLVSRPVETGRSSTGTIYYNDELICINCNKIRNKKQTAKIVAIFLTIVSMIPIIIRLERLGLIAIFLIPLCAIIIFTIVRFIVLHILRINS